MQVWQATKLILQYLKGTLNFCISFSVCTCSEELQQLLQFYNVDCEGNVDQIGSPPQVIALLLAIKLCHGVTRELLMLICHHISIVVYF
jgi:hypothetical protein